MSKFSYQYETTAGFIFVVNPDLKEAIALLTKKVRSQIEDAKKQDKYIGYLSIPVSKRGGGDFDTNIEMGKAVATRVNHLFGEKLWLLNPGAYNLGKDAKGGDYMAVWADVLAGFDGKGNDFDLVYFVGPNDVWPFFGAESTNKIGAVEGWLDRMASESKHYKCIAEDPENRKNFIRYYALRGSTAYSKGAHDEWNIIIELNKHRPIGKDIAVFYDGAPIEPGDFDDRTDRGDGIELLLH